MAAVDAYLIEPDLLRRPWHGNMLPLGFVDLANVRAQDVMHLPPFPLIGLGDPDDVRAGPLDAVIEPPVSRDWLVATVIRNPAAAAALIALLRGIDGQSAESALALESLCYGMLQGSAGHAAWLASRVPPAASQPEGRVIVTRTGNSLSMVIDRPGARNAIDATIRDQLFEAVTLATLDPEIGHVSLRSTGNVFSIGAELAEFGTIRDPATAFLIRSRTLPAHPLAKRPEIVEVHVQGPCIGAGLEMAAFAGRVTASPDAWFQLPELAMGLIPGAGGCVSVSRRIGRRRAALMILSGKRITASTALRWGLIDAIVDKAPVDPGRADID